MSSYQKISQEELQRLRNERAAARAAKEDERRGESLREDMEERHRLLDLARELGQKADPSAEDGARLIEVCGALAMRYAAGDWKIWREWALDPSPVHTPAHLHGEDSRCCRWARW